MTHPIRWLGPCAFAAVLVTSTQASAQDAEIDIDRFDPAITYGGFVQIEGSQVRDESDRFQLGLFANYAHQPLVIANADGELVSTVVGTRLGFDLYGSLTVAGPFAIGFGLPLFLGQTGDFDPGFGGIGDLRIVPKLRILDDRDTIGLALLAELRAPTHAGDFSGGTRAPVFWPRLVLDHAFGASGLRLGTNLGVEVREGSTFANVEAASEFTWGAALGYRIGGPLGAVELGLELDGGVGLAQTDVEETPVEIGAYVAGKPDPEWELVGGPAIGAVPGYGEPMFRLFFGVRYTPTSHDRDHDGIPDDEDKCPDQAENFNGIDDRDGCPDEDGDDDVDGIPNSEDECPAEKETINGVQDEDGCPDGGPAKVIREDGKISILENIEFESGSANIKQESYSMLNQVALVMKANPDIEKLRVEGHTDETGSRDVNMRLSKDRAESVKRYLVGRGVSTERLEAEGFGPDKPLVSGSDKEAYAKNRRVEFVIEQK